MSYKAKRTNSSLRRRAVVLALVAVLTLGVAAGSLLAQTQFGTVSGRVLDTTGAIVPGAKVTLTNIATNARQESTTNDEGLFVIANVLAGTYDVTVEKSDFKKTVQRAKVDVAQRLELDLALEVGQVTEIVTVTEATLTVNTLNAELSKQISAQDIQTLPLLTRNPYALVSLAPGTADTATANGDTRGIGITVAGGRSSSLNFLLDGAENNETFTTGPSTIVPIDAIQEFRVQTNNMTAEFGRNTLVTNVVTKSGTNEFHGSAYHFYRGSALSTETFEDKASGNPKANFVRNNFGASVGSKIIRDKMFYFGSFEGLRVASSGNLNFFVPTQEFFNNSSSNMQAYLTAGGGIPSHGSLCMTADDVTPGGLFQGGTSTPIPGNTQLFCRTSIVVPVDAGGGTGQDTWSGLGKLDYRFSDRTSLSGRFAYYNLKFPAGAGSQSPFPAFNTGFTFESHSSTVTLTHSFTPTIFSESRIAFSRTNPNAPLGEAPFTVPCVQYGGRFNTPTGDQIVFPGYLPNLCGGFSIPSGGPQNTYSAFSGWTWLKGKHTLKWGSYLSHLRDNHTFGAVANASINVAQPQNLLDGETETSINVAIDPNGKFPGQTYDVATDGAFRPPSFTRHFRYNEVAFYGEDQIKLHPRFTLTLGLRWEYFGVLHSPGRERFLDANLFLDAIGPFRGDKTVFEQIRDARFSRTNNLFQQDWNNFGPRAGIAWDLFGTGRTVLRGGYGLYYDKNFGNALFNVIQNFPNYAVLTLQSNPVTPFPSGRATALIQPNQFDTLADAAGSGNLPLTGSARMLNREMVTAYAAQWNATLEHDLLGKGIIGSISYVGANGYQLYSLNNLNQRGACLLLVQVVPGSPCNPGGGNPSRINQSGLTGMNRRGNEGFSRYNAMNLELRTRQIASTGLTLSGTYTWAHSIDNASSFFNDSIFDGNGNFGFKDPFRPRLDKADSSNDIRHRVSLSWNWDVPYARGFDGIARQVLHGWAISGIWQAQTGGAFTVYDMFNFTSQCSISFTNACYPVQTGNAPQMDGRTEVAGAPNTFVLYDVTSAYTTQADFCASNTVSSPLGPLGGFACTGALYTLHSDMLAPRNSLRLPGFWNVDFGLRKDFSLPRERMKLQFRAEVFNLFNHSNLYANPNTNLVFDQDPTTPGIDIQQVTAKRGNRPGQVFGVARDRRNIQLALRLTW